MQSLSRTVPDCLCVSVCSGKLQHSDCREGKKHKFTFSPFLLLLNEDLTAVVHMCITSGMNSCNSFYPRGWKKVKKKAGAESRCSRPFTLQMAQRTWS